MSIAALVASGASAVTAHAVFPGANGRIAIVSVSWSSCGDCDPDVTGWTASRGARPAALAGASQVAFSPDGRRLAFVQPGGGIYVARPDGSRRQLLRRRSFGPGQIAWSPRGDKLAFRDEGDLFVMGAKGGSPRRLFSTHSALSDFAWAPSGAELAFASYGRSGESAAIHAVARNGQVRELGSGWHVSWSAAGWLAYERADGLYLAYPGSAPERLLEPFPEGTVNDLYYDGFYPGGYSWSPEGKRIAFPRGGRIYVARAEGGEARPITASGACCPQWSPDGRLIAFARGRAVFVVPARGGRSRLFARVPTTGCIDCDEWVDRLDWQARPRPGSPPIDSGHN